jgi:RNA polymerase sigma-70 factor, ECF subfamily
VRGRHSGYTGAAVLERGGSVVSATIEQDVLRRFQRALVQTGGPGVETAAHLNRLFERHWSWVHGLCLRFAGDEARAQDLAQEAMLQAFRKLHQFDGRAQFRTWLYAVTRSVCLMALRKRVEPLLEDDLIDREGEEATVLLTLQREERKQLVRDAMTAVLSPEEQEVVYLRYIEGLPQDRISDLLQLDQKSGARAVLQRSREKLRREIRRRLKLLGHGSSFVREPT